MIKGQLKTKPFSIDEILSYTDGGMDVFKREIKGMNIGRTFKHPLKEDRDPSGALYQKEGVWFLMDFASTFPPLTAVGYIQNKYGIGLREAINKIAVDSGIISSGGIIHAPVKLQESPVQEERELQISFTDTKWKKEHHLFWENTSVDEAHCRKYNTFAVKDVAIDRRIIHLRENEVVFAYYESIKNKVKLYFPQREKKMRFRGNVKGSHIWNLTSVNKCNKLLVQKSMKDLLVSTIIFPCVIATQNESHKIFTEELVDQIHSIADEIYVAYGSDEQGVRESTELSKKYNWKWCNPPRDLLPGINDFYGMAKKYGIKKVEELLKNKGII